MSTRRAPGLPGRFGRRLAIASACVTVLWCVPLPPAGASVTTQGVGEPRWNWPLAPRPRVERPFDRPDTAWAPGHRGIDLAAPQGATVFAVDDGLVTHVGVIAGRGTVSIGHVSGIRSTYEPIDATVRVGESVTRGQALGLMASAPSHCPSGCLHLGAKRGDTYLDPLLLLTVPRIVLMTPVPD